MMRDTPGEPSPKVAPTPQWRLSHSKRTGPFPQRATPDGRMSFSFPPPLRRSPTAELLFLLANEISPNLVTLAVPNRFTGAIAMIRWILCIGLCMTGEMVALAQDAKPSSDPVADTVAKLRQPLKLNQELNGMALKDLIAIMEKDHKLKFIVDEMAFKSTGETAILDKKLTIKQSVGGLRVGKALGIMLTSTQATYIVHKDHIGIVPVPEGETIVRVTGVYKERPLNEVLAEIADDHDVTILVAPQSGDARMTFINSRLLNVPLESAIELLAVQADLRVVKRKGAFLITGKDHANELNEETHNNAIRKIELESLRSGNPPKPAPVK